MVSRYQLKGGALKRGLIRCTLYNVHLLVYKNRRKIMTTEEYRKMIKENEDRMEEFIRSVPMQEFF